MINRLVVSTECPSCGAPLDFAEGSNAIQCRHCRSHLLVTGRKRLLSYYVSPKLDAEGAASTAISAWQRDGKECHVLSRQIYFIPYYRVTGHDFIWERAASKPRSPLSDPVPAVSDPFVESGDHDKVELRDRYIEKNFVACDLEGSGLYSIGVRPTVLRLKLFRKEVLEAMGKIVSVQTSPESALAHGMKTSDAENVVYRQVVHRTLSIIYFPFWVVEVRCEKEVRLTVVDAVAENVVDLDAPPSFHAILDATTEWDPLVIGFRPLTCPNCGWDLPVDPDAFIFFCSSCHRAWEVGGEELSQVALEIAESPAAREEKPARYLPFWVLPSGLHNRPFRFFVPAFRCRRLKFLCDLGIGMSRKQPLYSFLSGEMPDLLQDCYYDLEDAVLLAQFISFGLESNGSEKARVLRDFNPTNAKLTWFPFRQQATDLLDPFAGLAVPQNLLL